MKKLFSINFLALMALTFTSPLFAQEAGEKLADVYIGEGPSVNMSLSPKLTFLHIPDYIYEEYCSKNACPPFDEHAIGIYYFMKKTPKDKYADVLQALDKKPLVLVISAYIENKIYKSLSKVNPDFYGIAPVDSYKIGTQLYENYLRSKDKKILVKLADCSGIEKYLADETSTVYSPEVIRLIKPVVCVE